jgi:aryl-alcohol dehydrogenase-like predicted oxidoreductase
MAAPDTLRYAKIPLTHGSGAIPALGFGTLIPDPLATEQATKTALEVGFRHFDCSERYRNEQAVGDAMQEVFKAGTIQRKDVFVTTKLWNNNHRPERVKALDPLRPPNARPPAHEVPRTSRRRSGLVAAQRVFEVLLSFAFSSCL